MTFLKRLRVLTAVLAVAAAVAALGTTLFGDVRTVPPAGGSPDSTGRPDGARVIDELAVTKFSQLPAITFQIRGGETLFAWQVKPTLEAAPARPKDVLVVVDTSASQAGRPLQQARQILAAYAATLTRDDRVSVWVASTPAATRALTAGFQPADSDDVRNAAVALTEIEYGSGATDLKGGLNKALATLSPSRARHQMVLFLGDGESAIDPVTEEDRIALGGQMDRADVYFFAVPLGLKVNPHNLHGLAALTGGTLVRVQEDLANPAKRAEFVTRLKAAIDAPVLKADKYSFGAEVAEVYPTKLPALRADKPTLVMGKLAKPAAALTAAVTGKIGTKAVSLNLTQDLPPSSPEHFFLNLMLDQWRGAPHKEAPAMLQADRALALASTQVKLYRDEFLSQAVWAVTMERYEDAAKLYGAAKKIDPGDAEATAGLVLIETMKAGKVTKADLKKKIDAASDALKVGNNEVARTIVHQVATETQPPAGGAAQPPANPQAAADLIKEAEARRRVEEQRYRVLVEQTVRRARQLLRTDPDAAYQDLKRQRDEILGYEGIGDTTRGQLVGDLEAVMREVFVKGAEIKRAATAEREAIARTRQQLNEFDRQVQDQDRLKARIDAFRQLMQQARFELAYQEAQLMIQERIARGQTVPPAAVASYIIGQQATQLREWRELVRIREDRFLLTMMQVEKSHIPYPDEPPVHFPPARVWRELTELRKEKYENSILGPEASPTQKKLQSILENQRVSFPGNLNDTPLFELLQNMAKQFDVTFIIMEEYFKAEQEQNIKEKKPNLSSTRLEGLTLGNFLDVVLQSMNATFIVRPEYIEITTFTRRLEEKVTRVFPVADLVIPIPSSVNQQSLFQNLAFQNSQLAIFGAASLYGGGLQAIGGAFGNPFGAGGGGFPGGGFPGGGGMGGMQFGNLGAGGQAPNQGFGGGIAGVGGGNLGQFGNLGGQFGLQGGDQSQLLMQLIFETVAKGEWANIPNQPQRPGEEPDAAILPHNQLNSLGYYPPARALIVRGTSRYHPASSVKLKRVDAAMAAAPAANPGGGVLVIGPGAGPVKPPAANPVPPKDAVAAAPVGPAAPKPAAAAPASPVVITGDKPGITDPKLNAVAMRKKLDPDARRMWQQAIDWTVTDPGLIVACADFLMEFDEFASAAEVLKANLRKGLATEAWAHEALAVSLEMSQAAPAEVERAAMSAIDLDPTDPKAYLRAAKVVAGQKNFDLAVRFCRRAADFGPNQAEPYANALVYADSAKGVMTDTVDWATANLLRRDWAGSDGIDYHKQAKERLEKYVAKSEAAGVKVDGLRKVLAEQTQRDLIVELVWQGAADLDLIVTEPTGSVCSATNKRTTGGGVLQGDLLDQTDNDGLGGGRFEVYTAASAFGGTYKVTVKQAFGKPIGGTATLKVTRFKGTPKEHHDLIAIDLTNPKPVEIKLDGGSRKELAELVADNTDSRFGTTAAPVTTGMSGIGGGCGTAGSVMSAATENTGGLTIPVVVAAKETVMPGRGGSADVRASFKLNPDRKSFSVTATPVFATASGEVAMPRVPLLPGGEGGR